MNRDVKEKVRRLPFLFLSLKDASLAWHELYQEVVGLHSLPLFGILGLGTSGCVEGRQFCKDINSLEEMRWKL